MSLHTLTLIRRLQGLKPYCRITDNMPGGPILASRPPIRDSQPAIIYLLEVKVFTSKQTLLFEIKYFYFDLLFAICYLKPFTS